MRAVFLKESGVDGMHGNHSRCPDINSSTVTIVACAGKIFQDSNTKNPNQSLGSDFILVELRFQFYLSAVSTTSSSS
jgi:hypothetical protein